MPNKDSHLQTTISLGNIFLATAGIIGTCLMLAGYSYKVAYFNSFGINSDFIPMEFSEGVGEAFYMGMLLIIELFKYIWWPFYFFGALGVVIVMLTILFLRWETTGFDKKARHYLAYFNEDAKKPLLLIGYEALFEETKKYHFLAFCLFMVLLPFILFVIVYPFTIGLEEGNEQIQKYAEVENECKRLPSKELSCSQIIEISSGKVIAEGLLISGGSRSHLALYNGNTIKVFPRNSDYFVSVSPRVKSLQGESVEGVEGVESVESVEGGESAIAD